MAMQPSVIELNIDELVLEGFAPSERYQIGEAVQIELVRILTEQGLHLTRNVEIEYLNTNMIELPAQTQSQSTGARIARAVYTGLNSEE